MGVRTARSRVVSSISMDKLLGLSSTPPGTAVEPPTPAVIAVEPEAPASVVESRPRPPRTMPEPARKRSPRKRPDPESEARKRKAVGPKSPTPEDEARSARMSALRRRLVGRTIELSKEWPDCDDPENPFALMPELALGRQRLRVHAEQLEWTHAQIHPSGVMVKARSAAAVDRIAEQLDRLAPVKKRFGTRLACVYDRDDRRGFHLDDIRWGSRRSPLSRVAQVNAGGDQLTQIEMLLGYMVRSTGPSLGEPAYYVAYGELMDAFAENHATAEEAELLRSHWASSIHNHRREGA